MRIKYLISFLVFVLIFGFGLITSCETEEIKIEETKTDKESMKFGGDFFIPVEPFSNNGINEIYIYPDGREGNEISVEIIVTDEMIPKSDRDTIHIEISDEVVKVWGTSIEGITKEFKR